MPDWVREHWTANGTRENTNPAFMKAIDTAFINCYRFAFDEETWTTSFVLGHYSSTSSRLNSYSTEYVYFRSSPCMFIYRSKRGVCHCVGDWTVTEIIAN